MIIYCRTFFGSPNHSKTYEPLLHISMSVKSIYFEGIDDSYVRSVSLVKSWKTIPTKFMKNEFSISYIYGDFMYVGI